MANHERERGHTVFVEDTHVVSHSMYILEKLVFYLVLKILCYICFNLMLFVDFQSDDRLFHIFGPKKDRHFWPVLLLRN